VITSKKLQIYRRHGGDPHFSRESSIEDEDWRKIDQLLFELWNLKAGQSSADFAEQTRERLGQEAADADAALELWLMAAPGNTASRAHRPWWKFW